MHYSVRPILLFSLISLLGITARAEDKKLPIETTSNELVEISAKAIVDPAEIKEALGSDFGGDLVLVRVTVRPLSEKPVLIDVDDFLLVSSKDGQRSEPYRPGQLAGDDVLVVTRRETKQKTGFGVGLGGIMGGGGSGAGPTETSTKSEKTNPDKTDPTLTVLKDKMLPEKEITETVSGFLYFQVVGKIKPKFLELHYKSQVGKLALRFRP